MKKPKNILKYVFYMAIVAILGLGVYFALDQQQSQNTTHNTVQNAEPVKLDYLTYSGKKGEAALVTLKALNSQVVTKDSEYGEYIDSINGLVGGTDGKYWSFYVDGEMSTIGADSYIAKGGEKIEWKFIKLQ